MKHYQLKRVFSKEELQTLNKALGEKISKDYRSILEPDEAILAVVTLKGAMIFAADLIREIDVPLQIDFIRVASYGATKASSGNVVLKKDLEHQAKGRHVLVLDEIVDSGYTLNFLMEHFKKHEPKSLKVCTLLDKESRREVSVKVDYIGKKVDDLFLVGYGLDFDERYRNLPEIFELKN